MSKLEEFLAGERLDDVALFLTNEYLDSEGKLASRGETLERGVVLVVEGEKGRRMFSAGTGMDAMQFARTAMENDGHIDRGLTGGEAPDGGEIQSIFAFAEAQNEEVGGIYADGDVIHAYAYTDEGTAFSDRWVVGDE